MTWLKAILAPLAGVPVVVIRDTVILGVSAVLCLAGFICSPYAGAATAAGAAGVTWWFHRRKPDASES